MPQRLSHIFLAAAYSELTDRIVLCNSLPIALKISQLMHMHLSRSDISAAQASVCARYILSCILSLTAGLSAAYSKCSLIRR